jgi:hypothetical protein
MKKDGKTILRGLAALEPGRKPILYTDGTFRKGCEGNSMGEKR